MATSTASGLMLLNVARGSIRELLEDYSDYIRVHNGDLWATDSKEFKAAQRIGRENTESKYFIKLSETRSDIVVANIIIVLIKQCDYLIFNLIEALTKKFTSEGGFKERMFHARIEKRGKE